MNRSVLLFSTVVLLVLVQLNSCKDDETGPSPEVLSITPTGGVTETKVRITGSNFSAGDTEVIFDDVPATIETVTSTEIIAMVPEMTEVTAAAEIPVKVIVNGMAANDEPAFTYYTEADRPVLAPPSGIPGTEVRIGGQYEYFSTVLAENEVTFNDMPAQKVNGAAKVLTVKAPDFTGSGEVKVNLRVNGDLIFDPDQLVFTYIEPQPPAQIEIECEGTKSVEVQDFKITTIYRESFFYVIGYEMTLVNTGAEDLDFSNVNLQAYISEDDVLDSDAPGGGYGLSTANQSIKISRSANTGLFSTPADIDGVYLILEITFPSANNPDCAILIINEIDQP